MKLWRLCLLTGCLYMTAILVGCGSGGQDANAPPGKQGTGGGKIETVKWTVGQVLGPNTVEIGSSVGYCLGDERPHYGVVEVKESGRRAYITAHAVTPPEEPKGGLCEGVGTFISKSISFKRNLIAMELYDGVTKPPSLRWSPLRLPHK